MLKTQIVTERLILRDLQPQDNRDWLEIFNSDNVGKFLNKIDSIEKIDALILKKMAKYQDNAGSSISVIEKASDKIIGNIELKVNNDDNTATLSYVFNEMQFIPLL